MRAPRSRSVALRLAVGAALALLLSFLPLPKLEFVPVAEASVSPLTTVRSVGADLAEEMGAATGLQIEPDRVVGTDAGVEPFTTIGAVFDAPPSGPVLARLREPDGRWTDWQELEVNADEGPEPGSAEAEGSTPHAVTEPLWVGSAVGYELSLAPEDVDGAQVALVRERERRVVTDSAPLADASNAPPFGINTRASWGARSATSGSSASRLDLAVVHHTATSNSYSSADVPGILRSIQAFHMDANGWSDIGYNFLIDRFGRTWEGRAGGMGNPVIGAHAAGFNTGSVGVSLIGNFVGASPTASALEATSRVIGWKLGIYGVDPTGRANITSRGSTSIPAGQVVNLPRVVGHRDVGSTACPGSAYSSLGSVRNRAAQYYVVYESLRNPVGRVDSVQVVDRRVQLRGWVADPDTDDPVAVHVAVAGRWFVTTANQRRTDVAAAHPDYGPNRGFSIEIPDLPPGSHKLCAYGINQGRGTANSTLGCADIIVK